MNSLVMRRCPLWLAILLGITAWVYRAVSQWASPTEPAWGATLLLLSPLVIVPIVCARLERMEFPPRSRTLLVLVSWWRVPTALLAVPAVSLPISAASLGLAESNGRRRSDVSADRRRVALPVAWGLPPLGV
jgi:hypothetical protein